MAVLSLNGQSGNGDESDPALACFQSMVDSVGVKRFYDSMGLSTRQVNRILAGAQPNPVARLVLCLQSCETELGNEVLDHICQEMGGYFVRQDGDLQSSSANAVKECAEAIAAISDGHVSSVDKVEVREAISALIGLYNLVQ